jgi:hypothetical protein
LEINQKKNLELGLIHSVNFEGVMANQILPKFNSKYYDEKIKLRKNQFKLTMQLLNVKCNVYLFHRNLTSNWSYY